VNFLSDAHGNGLQLKITMDYFEESCLFAIENANALDKRSRGRIGVDKLKGEHKVRPC
jgi:hypothetical protein